MSAIPKPLRIAVLVLFLAVVALGVWTWLAVGPQTYQPAQSTDAAYDMPAKR